MLLADHAALVGDRVPDLGFRGERLLATEIETVVRDLLTAVEFSRTEKVQAAAALAKFSRTSVSEAAQLLTDLSHRGGQVTFEALSELAQMALPLRRRAYRKGLQMVLDKSLCQRERLRAAKLIDKVASGLPTSVLDFVRHVAFNDRSSDICKVEALFMLRHTDGLGPLRAFRDNEQVTPGARWQAATRLIAYAADDRSAAAQLLHRIAIDPTSRPSLRWQGSCHARWWE